MSDVEIKVTFGKRSRGRFPVSVAAGNQVVATGRYDPYILAEIDAIVADVNKAVPGLNGELDELRRQLLSQAAGPRSSARPNNKPVVVIGTDEHRVTDEVVKALASDQQLFKRGPLLARVVRDDERKDDIARPPGAPTITTAPPAWLRERITETAHLAAVDDRGELRPAHPPAWLTPAVAARGQWPEIRELTAISDAPVLRPDGSIHQTPGYDPVTGVMFESSTSFPLIPEDAGLDDADAAATRLLEVVSDFRFESPEHKAAWLAGLLTPLGRHAFAGSSPGFLTDANVRGAGKGLSVQVAAEIALGRQMPVAGYRHDAAEMAKVITSLAMAGDAMFLLDNVEGNFGNEALDRVLTCTRWKDRLLGTNTMVDLPFLSVMYATGNNVQVAADTARRLLHIRLDVLDEHPEERADFKHPDLLAWARNNRPALLVDALTILAAYCRAGRPGQGLTPYGSFEGWSALIRSAVVWCGLPDPCLTRAKLAELSDSTSDVLGQLVQAWKGYDPFSRGVVIAEMVAKLYPREFPPNDPDAVAMRAALEALTGCQPGKPSVRTIGNTLRHYRRRVFRDCFLDIDANQNNMAGAVWKLCEPKTTGESVRL